MAIVRKQPTRRLSLSIAPRAKSQIIAEFDLDEDGDPYQAQGDEYLFEMRLSNPPSTTKKVRYKFHDKNVRSERVACAQRLNRICEAASELR